MRLHIGRPRLSAGIVAIGTVAALGVATASPALADISSVFQLDGDVTAASSDATPDWQTLFTAGGQSSPYTPVPTAVSALPANFNSAVFTRDFVPGGTSDSTTYTQGSKDTLDVGGWSCVGSSNVTDKGDIQNTYATAYIDPTSHDLILFFGMEKNSSNGDNNMAVWFLQDPTVGCSNSSNGGSGVAFTGHHTDGDVLLVAAFINGGAQPQISAYRWNGGATGSLGATPVATGTKCGGSSNPNLCAITNNTSSITTPWITQNKASSSGSNKTGLGHTLGADQFYEGGADISQIFTSTPCFATYLTDTRSSQSLTATLYDYANGSLPTCGSLKIHKYIDADMSGTNNTGDATSGTAVTGWSFAVTGPNGLSCTGATDSTGTVNTVDCSASTSTADQARTTLTDLPPGSYTVTETQKSGYFNTDPGGTGSYSTAATVAKNVTVNLGGTTNVSFGNECFVAKTFEVDNVPANQPQLIAHYTVTSGPDNGQSGDVDLTTTGTTATGTLSNTLVQTDTISWYFYESGDSTHTIQGATNESLAAGGYPACALTNTKAFENANVTGAKYKDINHNGSQDAGEPGLAGFQFQLKNGATVVQTVTSSADGSITFTGVAPGTYSVHEVPVTGWQQTQPVNSDGTAADASVTVHLGDSSDSFGDFGNTPLSSIGATFSSLGLLPGTTTAATNGQITCTDANGNTVGSGTTSASASNLYIGTYTCRVVITDP